MTTPAQSIDAQSPMRQAASKMKEANVGMLPVMSGEQCVGVVTDRDLVVRGLADGGGDKRIDEIMTPNPVCLNQETSVKDAIRTMEDRQVGRVVVTDSGGKPIGVVSGGAISMAMKGDPMASELAADLSAAHSNGRRP